LILGGRGSNLEDLFAIFDYHGMGVLFANTGLFTDIRRSIYLVSLLRLADLKAHNDFMFGEWVRKANMKVVREDEGGRDVWTQGRSGREMVLWSEHYNPLNIVEASLRWGKKSMVLRA
jgi:hypothetical protein